MNGKKNRFCGSVDCTAGKPVEHSIIGVETPEGMSAKHYRWKCSHCGYESLEAVPRTRVHRRTWPYYNSSVGETFVSESHEQDYVKKNNLQPV